jgi:hypothetical protein
MTHYVRYPDLNPLEAFKTQPHIFNISLSDLVTVTTVKKNPDIYNPS